MATSADWAYATPSRRKKWRARVKRDGIEYFLGYFPTKEEAEITEQKFKDYYEEEEACR